MFQELGEGFGEQEISEKVEVKEVEKSSHSHFVDNYKEEGFYSHSH